MPKSFLNVIESMGVVHLPILWAGVVESTAPGVTEKVQVAIIACVYVHI